MKTVTEWVEDHQRFGDGSINDLKTLVKLVRKEALEAAELIARRDSHTETGDKIQALNSLP